MAFPRPDEAAKAFFESALPDDPRVHARPMFGNVAGFANGNMFMGLFGNDLFVRLPEAQRSELIAEGGFAFEVMPGRPMTEYVTFPQAWRSTPDKVHAWVSRSPEWAAALPERSPRAGRSGADAAREERSSYPLSLDGRGPG